MVYALFCFVQDIEAFPPTLVDASTALLRRQKANPHLGNDLVTNEPALFIHVHDKAYIHEDVEVPDFVTIVNAGVEPVDIPVATLLTYTNCVKKEQACSLLEIAIASGSLQLFVVQNDFWKNATNSSLRGIPLINTELLLQSVVPSKVGDQVCFQTPNTIVVEDVAYNIHIHVEQVRCGGAAHSPLCSWPSSLHFRFAQACHCFMSRSRSPSPAALRLAPRTLCSPAFRARLSAPIRSASRCLQPTGARSPAIGSVTSMPPLVRSRLPWACRSASSPPRTRTISRQVGMRPIGRDGTIGSMKRRCRKLQLDARVGEE